MPARLRALNASVNESMQAIACDTMKDSLVSMSDAGPNREAGLCMLMMVVIQRSLVDCR
jgi:hypothetical protein